MGLAITSSRTEFEATLGLYESRELGTAENENGRFKIVEGLTKELVEQLKERSLDLSDVELKKTSDYERFGIGSYEEWRGIKERTMFALVTDTGTLAAIAWLGPKPLARKSMKHLPKEEARRDERSLDSGAWHTIVYRSYAPFRGKGLMKDFVRFVMEKYQSRYPGSKLWAGIFTDNPASIGLSKALGFTEASKEGDETILTKE